MTLCGNYNLDHPCHSYLDFFWLFSRLGTPQPCTVSQTWVNHTVLFTVAFGVISISICLLIVSDIYQLPAHSLLAMAHLGYVWESLIIFIVLGICLSNLFLSCCTIILTFRSYLFFCFSLKTLKECFLNIPLCCSLFTVYFSGHLSFV